LLISSGKFAESLNALMGQSATLYLVDKSEFSKIGDNPEYPVADIAREKTTFDKSFEGLLFLITKGSRPEDISLVRQIFYPEAYVGDEIDFENIDIDELPDDFDFDKQPLYFNEPNTVSEIADLLAGIEPGNIIALFDHAELNEHDIEPGQVWTDDDREGVSFNAQHMAAELLALKSIYETAREQGAYIVAFVD
jgi:hypothetical protein